MTDAEVRTAIQAIIPELKDPDLSYITKVERLRDWLHRTLPIADRYTDLGKMGVDHNRDSLASLLASAESRRGGYYCGGIAEIARKIYMLFGYDAITMDFGISEAGATHVETLVRLTTPEGPIWTVQDAYFNCTFRDENGSYLGLLQIAQLIRSGRAQQIHLDQSDEARSPLLYDDREDAGIYDRRYDLALVHTADLGSFDEFSGRWRFEILDRMFGLRAAFAATLPDDNPVQLFMFPFSAHGQPDADKLLSQVLAERDAFLRDQQLSIEHFEQRAIEAIAKHRSTF